MTPHIPEMNTDAASARRFPSWIALFLFSAICLAASESQKVLPRTSGAKWILSVEVISMVFALFACAAYVFARDKFESNRSEGAVILLLLAFWAAGLPVISKDSGGFVVNANLYFFSWGALFVTLYMAGDMAQEKSSFDVSQLKAAPKKVQYYLLCTTSLIVMASAVRVYGPNECGNGESATPVCPSTKYAISLGVISFVTAVSILYVTEKHGLEPLYEAIVTGLLFVMWIFGVAYITFGTDAPAPTIGNLYFATWISFILAMLLMGAAMAEYMSKRANSDPTKPAVNQGPGESSGDEAAGDVEAPGAAATATEEAPAKAEGDE